MIVYRIVKLKKRTTDPSGTGAFNVGGRWNNPGTYAVYTSENPSLALLEILVHSDESELPPNMFVMTIEIDDRAPIIDLPDADLPPNWRLPENIELKEIGDRFFSENQVIGLKVRSAVMPNQYNIILNPRFPGYQEYVRVIKVDPLEIDQRLKNN
jgi:RES domain-containing protein